MTGHNVCCLFAVLSDKVKMHVGQNIVVKHVQKPVHLHLKTCSNAFVKHVIVCFTFSSRLCLYKLSAKGILLKYMYSIQKMKTTVCP